MGKPAPEGPRGSNRPPLVFPTAVLCAWPPGPWAGSRWAAGGAQVLSSVPVPAPSSAGSVPGPTFTPRGAVPARPHPLTPSCLPRPPPPTPSSLAPQELPCPSGRPLELPCPLVPALSCGVWRSELVSQTLCSWVFTPIGTLISDSTNLVTLFTFPPGFLDRKLLPGL